MKNFSEKRDYVCLISSSAYTRTDVEAWVGVTMSFFKEILQD